MPASTARTRKPNTRARFAAMMDGPEEKLNSQKEPVPFASPVPVSREEAENQALLNIAGGDPDKVDQLRKAIESQTAARYASAVALDNAMNLVLRRREGMLDKLTPEYVERRRRIICTPEVLERVLAQVSEGVSIYRQCRDNDDLPTSQSVNEKLNSPEWIQRYQVALLRRADKHVDEITELQRELQLAVAAGASAEVVNAIKISINTLQWVAARLNPKYGDKQQIDLNATIKLTEEQVDGKLAAIMAKAKRDGLGPD